LATIRAPAALNLRVHRQRQRPGERETIRPNTTACAITPARTTGECYRTRRDFLTCQLSPIDAHAQPQHQQQQQQQQQPRVPPYDVTRPNPRPPAAYARHRLLSPRQQCGRSRSRSRRHEEGPRSRRRPDVRRATPQEAPGHAPVAPHPARPVHRRPHHRRDGRLRRLQGLLRPAAAARHRDTMQDYRLRHGAAGGAGGVPGAGRFLYGSPCLPYLQAAG